MAVFQKGSRIPVNGGGEAIIVSDEPLGQGGQGEVYLASYQDTEYALKWYTNKELLSNKEFKDNLRSNVNHGSVGSFFVWPQFMVEDSKGGFGYIMDLIPSNYVSMVDILNKCKKKLSPDGRSVIREPVGFKSMEVQLIAAINIINSFKLLQRAGKCYKDLNDGGLYFNTETGDVLVCDCDNISPDREGTSIGKPGYMAPELVNHTGKSSMDTDKHSLAVILFKLLFKDDPLRGKRVYEKVTLTGSVELDVYGNNPLFIMDPIDTSNRPVRGINDNVLKFWDFYPSYLTDEFVRTFGPGLKDPSRRTIPQEWFKVVSRLLSETISCPCGRPSRFLSKESPGTSEYVCPKCGLRSPIFTIGGYDEVLCQNAKLREYQTDENSDEPTVSAEIVENKKMNGVYGIKNVASKMWIARYGDGRVKQLTNGVGTVLSDDLVIDFGDGCMASKKVI